MVNLIVDLVLKISLLMLTMPFFLFMYLQKRVNKVTERNIFFILLTIDR